ncbi:hypothetical protein [Streptomyces poriticola]|uniref:hypothetical protein n=1 Tax=Streptomyces poriticola TaxID=3120506 RepID=UPI002FCE2956
MLKDPYAVMRALLRAEATRSAPAEPARPEPDPQPRHQIDPRDRVEQVGQVGQSDRGQQLRQVVEERKRD